MRPANFHGVASAMAAMLIASACSAPVQGEAKGPPASSKDTTFDRGAVQEALRCLPSKGGRCAMAEDALGEVEDAFPIVDVASVEHRGDEVHAVVLRHVSLPSEGVFFEYRFTGEGKLLSRSCLHGAPAVGDWLQNLRKPDDYDGSRVIYHDRCTYRGPCGAAVGRRVSFAVDGEGRLGDPRELGAARLSEPAEGMDCFFIPQRVSLPKGPAIVRTIKDQGHVSTEEGDFVPLAEGFNLQGREVLLGPGSSIRYEVGGLLLRLDSDLDRGLRLEFVGEERWVDAWASVEAFVAGAALDWSPPFLSDRRQVLRLRKGGAAHVCTGRLTDVCSRACRGFREAGSSFHGGDRVLLSGPGAILGGTCTPSAGRGEGSKRGGRHAR